MKALGKEEKKYRSHLAQYKFSLKQLSKQNIEYYITYTYGIIYPLTVKWI